MRPIAASAASKPPSRKIAPNMASSASASIDGREAPPLLNSPSPSLIALPRSSARASRQSVSLLTRLARIRESSPSGSCGKRRYSASAIAQLRIESPMNSSRSLWSAPKLRCVSAWRSSSGRRNTWPSDSVGAEGGINPGASLGDGGLEVEHQAHVTDQVQLVAPRRGRHQRVAFLDDVDIAAAHRIDVIGTRLQIEIAAKFGQRERLGRILQRLGHHLLDGVVLDVRRQRAEPDHHDRDDDRSHEQEPQHRQPALRSALVHLLSHQRMLVPIRLNAKLLISSQLNQMKNALPRMWSSGTKPQ